MATSAETRSRKPNCVTSESITIPAPKGEICVTSISTGYTAFRGRRALAPATLACMGIVFGDIGTSPLYTLQVAVKAASPGGAISPEAVIGIVSLIFWSLIIVISIKYATLIMRASNHGEGGILAPLALISPQHAKRGGWRAAMVIVGLIGATLLYGDGTITPCRTAHIDRTGRYRKTRR